MTKIATNKPEVQCRPVYLNKDTFEVWYSEPKSLGKITNRGGYWYTADGHRFVSSRDAMGYMLRVGNMAIPINLQVKAKAMPVPVPPPPVKRVAPVSRDRGNSATIADLNNQLGTDSLGNHGVNQNHPMFQQFLEFQDWVARRKAVSLSEKSVDNASN